MAGFIAWGVMICSIICMPEGALAAAGHPSIPGAQLSVLWAIPFVCMLLSIAIMPLALPHFWEKHFGKIAAFWGLAFLTPCLLVYGFNVALYEFLHIILLDYVPFLVLLFTLFTVAGGVRLTGSLVGTPVVNTGLLAVGTVLASWMGTTGAAMLLIRPLLKANAHRKYRVHSVVFFIFLVANIGGSLTPLGDPPLFLGFLKGVDFFWTARHIFPETLLMLGILLALFYALDSWFFRQADQIRRVDPTPDTPQGLGFEGRANFALLAVVVGLVLLSGVWKSEVVWNIAGTEVGLPGLVRDVGLVLVTLASLALTPRAVHEANQFNWGPMLEVAKLFAGIFITIIPVIAMLKAGVEGPFGAIVRAVTHPDGSPNPAMYFWATGVLSSFLDNAPTYLVFFNTAGGDATVLMTQLAPTLAAISAGAVFMGANTYIGNAPNLMVKAIAEDRGVKMPSFFGYMAWSGAVLLPLFVLITFVFF